MTKFPFWLQLALDELGTKEFPGVAVNPRIAEYLATVGMPSDDGIGWCSGFVEWCFEHSFIKGTKNALARSWTTWGEKSDLRHGAVVVFRRGSDQKLGHVNFLLDYGLGENVVYGIGGNQRDRVSISPYLVENIVAVRWPKLEA